MMQTQKLDKLKSWLKENTEFKEGSDENLDLIDSGILTSLQLMEFILFLEHLSGQPVDLDRSTMDKMRTINLISANYLQGAENKEAVA
ncbi:MAG: hypothetical protein WA790_21135 [Sulfitobacter sp.]